jgi:hypothetical protein
MKVNAEKLLEYIGRVGDDLVVESETAVMSGSGLKSGFGSLLRRSWMSAAAVFVLALAITGIYFMQFGFRDDGNWEIYSMTDSGALSDPATAFGILPGDAGDAWAGGEAVIPLPDAMPEGISPFGARVYQDLELPMLSLQEINFPFFDGDMVFSVWEMDSRFPVRTASLSVEGLEDSMPVYRRTPHYNSGQRLVPKDSPTADEMVAKIGELAEQIGLLLDEADEINIKEQLFDLCFCCGSFSGHHEPFAVLPVDVTVRWGDVGITYNISNGQRVFRHYMHDGMPRGGCWYMDAMLSSYWGAYQILYQIPDDYFREFIGDYPIITPAEAMQRLLEGNYYASVRISQAPVEERIAHVEIVYVTHQQNLFMPFFLFYIEMPPDWRGAEDTTYFGLYYVPAVRDEFLLP